jgi:two-component system chemotaxis response regulator CheY
VFSELAMNCTFVEAANGEEALEQLGMHEINLILLDWNMPKLSGIDFLKIVRGMDRYKSLPIIMVTSESAKYNVIEALKSGATDYITKPINLKLFGDKLVKILNK